MIVELLLYALLVLTAGLLIHVWGGIREIDGRIHVWEMMIERGVEDMKFERHTDTCARCLRDYKKEAGG